MRFSQWIACLSVGLLCANQAIAAPTQHMEQLQVPQCLASYLSSTYRVLAENNEFRIIEVPSQDLNIISLQADKAACGRFVNVSHKLTNTAGEEQAKTLLNSLKNLYKASNESWQVKHQSLVNAAISHLEEDNILTVLRHLTNYENRSATKTTGVEAAKWLKETFDNYAKEANRTDVKSFFVKTGSYYKQPSLVTVIGKNLKTPGIVIGAHMDTLDGRMPGAGDDGSGSATLMEVARIMLTLNPKQDRPIYLIWYSAEERGLVGSQYVVQYFKKNKIPVKAVMQFDMTGFRNDPNDPTMWVFRDYTDKNLTNFIKQLITDYVRVPVAESECGYGCSDHASWTEVGIPAAFPCETDFEHHNPKIHTSGDTMDRLSIEHMNNFATLGLAFLFELAVKDA